MKRLTGEMYNDENKTVWWDSDWQKDHGRSTWGRATHPPCGKCFINNILNVKKESVMGRSSEGPGRGPLMQRL